MPQIADNIKKVAVTRDGFQAQFIELDQVLFFDFVNHFNNFTTCIYCIIYKKKLNIIPLVVCLMLCSCLCL